MDGPKLGVGIFGALVLLGGLAGVWLAFGWMGVGVAVAILAAASVALARSDKTKADFAARGRLFAALGLAPSVDAYRRAREHRDAWLRRPGSWSAEPVASAVAGWVFPHSNEDRPHSMAAEGNVEGVAATVLEWRELIPPFPTRLQVRAAAATPADLWLQASRRGREFRVAQTQGVPTGDTAFDAVVVVECSRPEVVPRLFDAPMRETLLGVLHEGRDARVTLGFGIAAWDVRLTMERGVGRRDPADVRRAATALHRFVSHAERVAPKPPA